ncbi:hypothetical protein [Aquamicrobium terrae]|uniref:Transcriptional regulator n=1 Tax=Aquamicrobium terrae TaxID=1324945 RepID=A0ABV2N7T1_9HYPH
MADFVAVLKKTLGGLGDTTPEIRAKVYDKARATIAAKLAALDPAPPAAVAERQKKMLEDAIATVERDYAPPPAPDVDPLAELENLFSSIDRNKNQQTHTAPSAFVPPAPKVEPVAGLPVPKPAEHPVAPLPVDVPAEKPQSPAATASGAEREPSPRPAPVFPAQPVPERPLAGSAVPPQDAPRAEDVDDVFDHPPETAPLERRPELAFDDAEEGERRSYKRLIAAVVALLVVAGGGYGIWLNKDAFGDLFGSGSGEPKPVVVKPVKVPPPSEDTAAAEPAQPEPAPAPANGGEASESTKFTQRLLPDGNETDPGPAGGGSSIGEGSSVVSLTTPPAAVAPDSGQAPGPAPSGQQNEAGQAGVAVGQKAIYYEERTNVAQGSAETGNVVWSLVQESPGGDEPPEPAIRGEVQVPGKDVQLRMTIRRNADETLPASHIIEMIFLTPAGFEGGGIDNLLRIALKKAEQEAGSPLIGIPAKIADGYFLVALNDTKADEDANLALLRNQEWIDVPVVYKSGRRALLTMEKGIPGDKVFDEAIKAWQAKTSG